MQHFHWCPAGKHSRACSAAKCNQAVVSTCEKHDFVAMMKRGRIYLLAGLMLLMGCPGKGGKANYIIPAPCLTEPIRLEGCSSETDCKKVRVRYNKACPDLKLDVKP